MRSFLGLAWLAATCGLSCIPTAQAAAIGAERLGAAQQTELIHKRQTTTTTGNETFNPLAANNLATYYGRAQSAATLNLNALCSTLDVDVVVLAFLTQFNGLNEIPTLDFGTACSNYGKRTTALSCSVLAQNITYCQSLGVKVFLSVGGASGNITFSSATQATQAATTLWNLFGAGTGATSLRPFGNVTLDGFDFGTSEHRLSYPSPPTNSATNRPRDRLNPLLRHPGQLSPNPLRHFHHYPLHLRSTPLRKQHSIPPLLLRQRQLRLAPLL